MSEAGQPDSPSPYEWIDDMSNCTICGEKVTELRKDSHQESDDTDDQDSDEPSTKRTRTHTPVSTEHTELARMVYTKQLKLCYPTVSRCTNCIKRHSSRLTEDQLATTLLDAQFEEIQAVNNLAIANNPCLTMMIDGWSHVKEGLMHAMLHVCVHSGMHDGEPMFLYSTPEDDSQDIYSADGIAEIIGRMMTHTRVTDEIHSKLHAVITDNTAASSVLSEAWNLVERKCPRITCYGSSSVAIKQLAMDLCEIRSIDLILEKNHDIAEFFGEKDTRKKLEQRLKDDNSLELRSTFPAVNNVHHIGLQNFILLRRNLRLKESLRSMFADEYAFLEQVDTFEVVRKLVVDNEEMFWESTQRVTSVFNVLVFTLRICQNCILPLSAVPHIWAHITLHLGFEALTAWGFEDVTIESIREAITSRRAASVRPVTCAAHALDPYFRGQHLSNEEWDAAHSYILRMTPVDYQAIASKDFTEYKTKACSVSELDKYLREVRYDSYSLNQIQWWNNFAPSSPLVSSAYILLSMPASGADVKRYVRLHNAQMDESKWGVNVRDKLESVSYNLNIKRCHDAEKKNLASRMKEVLSLCTSHRPPINICEDNANPTQADLRDPKEKHDDLSEEHPEKNNAVSSEDTSKTSEMETWSQDSNPACSYVEYDSSDEMSLWSSASPLRQDGAGSKSSRSDNEKPSNSDEQTRDSYSHTESTFSVDEESTESAESLTRINDPSTSDQENATTDQGMADRASLMDHRFVADKENIGPANSTNLGFYG